MADPPPPSSGNGSHSSATTAAAETLTLTLPSSEAAITNSGSGGGGPHHSKRQRRPSVRLGDPGEQPASTLSSLLKPHSNSSWRSNKTRHITNFDRNNSPDDNNPLAALAFRRGPRDPKMKKPKRARSNWSLSSRPVDEDSNRSPSTPHSDAEQLISEWNGLDSNNGGEELHGNGRIRSPRQVPDPLDRLDEEEGEEEEDDDDELIGGVRSWLNRLGLGRYAPVFEIHEVDEEVLPLLTLEDLKDMGINAVGSRRKMFYAIQKLRKS